MKNYKLTRNIVLSNIINKCLAEMYAKAQPSANYKELCEIFKENVNNGAKPEDERFYDRYYLSQEEYKYIVNKYIQAYGLEDYWAESMDVLKEYLTKGGLKDIYIPEQVDENGFTHPGYRSAEDVPPLKEQLTEILNKFVGEKNTPELIDTITDKVMETINNCADFYEFGHRDLDTFNFNVALGASPTSNPNVVKEYWKKQGKDIEIVERNPKLFWYEDEGYTEEELAYEFEDLGENWREELDKQWKDEILKRKQAQEERLKKLQEEFNKEKDKNN